MASRKARCARFFLPTNHHPSFASPNDLFVAAIVDGHAPGNLSTWRTRSIPLARLLTRSGAHPRQRWRMLGCTGRPVLTIALLLDRKSVVQCGSYLDGVAEDSLHKRMTQLAAPEAERARIACELHDVILQDLILLTMQLRNIAPHSEAPPEVREARAAAARALTNARALLERLRSCGGTPAAGDSHASISTVLDPISDLVTHPIRLKINNAIADSVQFPVPMARELGLILREAVVNAIRHSGARLVSCNLRTQRTGVLMEIVDDGCGFEPAAGLPGFGLQIMAARARVLGITLQIRSQPRRGTTVRLQLRRAHASVANP
jgi:signal transduction histidine kinase